MVWLKCLLENSFNEQQNKSDLSQRQKKQWIEGS
jgi:hypothetical protein